MGRRYCVPKHPQRDQQRERSLRAIRRTGQGIEPKDGDARSYSNLFGASSLVASGLPKILS